MELKAKAAVERGEKRREPPVREGCAGDMLVVVELRFVLVRSVVVAEAVLWAPGGAKSLAVAGAGADSKFEDIVMILL